MMEGAGGRAIPSDTRNPGLCRVLRKPRSLTSFGMTGSIFRGKHAMEDKG